MQAEKDLVEELTIEELTVGKAAAEGDILVETSKSDFKTKTTVATVTETKMTNIKGFEPPAFVSKTKSYSAYKADLKRWSRITSVEKKLQAEVVVYSLEGHPSQIKDKIEVKIGDKLENNENGIELLLEYLDTIYQEDEMSDAWTKFKNFQKLLRNPKQDIPGFIADFGKEYLLVKGAGCEYSDTILAFRLLEATNLSESDEKFVLTGVDFVEGKAKGNLESQVKSSLKKFQGTTIVSSEAKDGVSLDTALINKVKDVLVSQGCTSGKFRGRKRSSTNPKEGFKPVNSPYYKGRKNPLGGDGKVLRCFKCMSEYHMADKCQEKMGEKLKEAARKKSDDKCKDEAKEKSDEALLVTAITKALASTNANGRSSAEHVMICSSQEGLSESSNKPPISLASWLQTQKDFKTVKKLKQCKTYRSFDPFGIFLGSTKYRTKI